jgi:glycosyltransferase involved in cell wall biosynthesis
LSESEKLLPNQNIKMAVINLADDIFGKNLDNIYNILPPVFVARDLKLEVADAPPEILTIGFFGQYRREKKIENLLAAFKRGNYNRKVKLLVQGATMHEEDAEEFERIIKPYENLENISVIRGALIGKDWQQAIINVDALLLPYSAPRFKYHWGGMLFTALGYEKPVVSSDDMNPEIFSRYKIGETFKSGNLEDLTSKLEYFINNFDENFHVYKKNLREASENFSPVNFGKRFEKIILKK